ncbi:hypothetical protein P3X46_010675 [Hevea brasiliensis]|uniref:Leucine-rich repeat-containing N-terminal plant-type domain-containing protein n=2 Tax=Hevea brasiliensis TaxID=3981 RepID=A0ABQ9MF59_HEVBR|nr:hypothetical protein P3X46_010675 [Hevea brasiliensis]
MELALVKCMLLALIVWLQIHKSKSCLEEERLALLGIKDSLKSTGSNGDHLLSSWIDQPNNDCCKWERVICNSITDRVIRLSLNKTTQNVRRANTLFLNVSLLRHFEKLTHLDLSSNKFGGWIENEEVPNLQGNYLGGSLSTLDFTAFKSLEVLDLSGNGISGIIPNYVWAPTSLKALSLSGNSFHGSLQIQSFCGMERLEELDLSSAGFSGGIPSCLGNFTSLKMLNLSINQLYGEIPNNLSKLETLDLSHNNLSGEIPELPLNQSQIQSLNLSHNQLTGSIPKSFLNLSKMESLDLSYNDLSGRLPLELIDLKFLKVFTVAHNNLSGKIPEQFNKFNRYSYEGNPLLSGPYSEKNSRD